MALVKVWNDNTYPHTEKFKGKVISLQPGEYIEMDYEEAQELLGQFTPRVKRGDGTDDPKYFKMLRAEKPAVSVVQDSALINHADGARAVTKEELAAMMAQYSHMRAPIDPEGERLAALAKTSLADEVGRLKSQNDILMERLAALEARSGGPVKRGPGRPRKEA